MISKQKGKRLWLWNSLYQFDRDDVKRCGESMIKGLDIMQDNNLEEYLRKCKAMGGKHPTMYQSYWHFAHTVEIGDLIAEFRPFNNPDKTHNSRLIRYGRIASDCYKIDNQSDKLERRIVWLGSFDSEPILDYGDYLYFKAAKDDVAAKVMELINISIDTQELPTNIPMTTPYDPYIKLLKESKNLILTGAPGTGKTYITTTLGVLLCAPERYTTDHKEQKRIFRELQQQGRIGFTTFHQSMDYEDFVEGLKPDTSDDSSGEMRFVVKKGLFRQMCDTASKTDEPCLLIIDEINRANISKVLGELITLLEPTKRLGEEDEFCVTLPYSGDTFGVPSNLYIIGTMNTADRSLGYIDYAIRRRFAFRALRTEPSALMNYYGGECDLLFKERELMTQVRKLLQIHRNKDFSIDDIMVGHSYFMARDEDTYNFNLKYKIKPLLEEYLRDGILVEKGTEVKDAILGLE